MKGQTSLEMLFIAVIILGVAVYLLNYYNQGAKDTIAFSIVRSDVDKMLDYAKIDGCQGHLENITFDKGKFEIWVSGCSDYINETKIEEDAKSVLKMNYKVVVNEG